MLSVFLFFKCWRGKKHLCIPWTSCCCHWLYRKMPFIFMYILLYTIPESMQHFKWKSFCKWVWVVVCSYWCYLECSHHFICPWSAICHNVYYLISFIYLVSCSSYLLLQPLVLESVYIRIELLSINTPWCCCAIEILICAKTAPLQPWRRYISGNFIPHDHTCCSYNTWSYWLRHLWLGQYCPFLIDLVEPPSDQKQPWAFLCRIVLVSILFCRYSTVLSVWLLGHKFLIRR